MDLICYWCLLLYTGFVFHLCGVRTTSTRGQSTEVIELHTTVQEEQPVGQVIMRLAEEIEKHDKNLQRMFQASSENKRFHLLPTHDASLFHINTDGSLLIAKRLDYEELCDSARLAKYTTAQTRHPGGHDSLPKSSHSLCHLSVRVLILQAAPTVPGKIPGNKESGGNTGGRQRQLRTVMITINLVDANDNRPTCSLNRLRKMDTSVYSGSDWIEVPENTPIGTIIASWKLSDRDTVPNGITDARLLGTKNGKSALLTVGELPFRLQFDDTTGPWSTVKLKLILIKSVEYINQQPNSKDSSDEMDVYSLKVFILDSKDPNTGSLWNSATIATTPGAHCHLQVSIVDINDHNPVWVSPINFINGQTLEMELAESKSYIQRDLIRLKATDGDRGLNARISYQWAHGNDFNFTQDSSDVSTDSYQDLVYRLFYLDAATGSLQLRGSNVDFESISRFHPRRSDSSLAPGRLPITLHVVAVDQPLNRSEQRFSPVGTIIIWLLDMNDHSPRIQIIGLYSSTDISELPFSISSSPIYPQVVYVAENLPSNDPVAFITVTDEDSAAHGGIACSLHQATFDRTQPENPAFQLIEVTQQTMSELPNDHILPEVIDTADASRSANYKMITTKSLDRERVATYQLNLSCIDSLISAVPNPITRLTSYRTIEVIVTDRNDNQPHIVGVIDRITGKLNTSTSTNGALMCSVREHAVVGTKICQLRADDLDQTGHTVSGSKGFSWWLEDSVRSLVDIERETGWLVVQPQADAQPSRQQTNTEFTARSEVGSPSSLLDREVLTELSFTVYVHDSPRTSGDSRLTASANILLRITDINDHVPKISEYNYFQISEGASPGTLIGSLVALDGDEPDSPNSALTYHILTPRDGADNMVVAQKRELPASTRVSGDSVANELRDIKLDEKTGSLLVGPNGLDRERQSFYKFVVAVSDGAATVDRPALLLQERHVVQTVVHITVEDENDNAPRIIYPESQTAIFTLACPIVQQQLPHTIAQIAVNDSDSGINAEVFYHLSPVSSPSFGSSSFVDKQSQWTSTEGKNDSFGMNETSSETDRLDSGAITLIPFQIDPQNGFLMIVSPPVDEQNREVCNTDRESGDLTALAEYALRVVVIDRGIPPLSSSVVLLVRIQPQAQTDTTDPSLQSPGQIPSYHLDRYNSPSGLPNGYEHPVDGSDGTNLRWAKLYAPVSPPVSSDLRNSGDTTLLSSLSSPDVFWAAIICLTIATGVLIFLIVLITTVTCHRRMKPAGQNNGPGSLNSETRQNEWAQSNEGIHDSRYGSRPLDNVEMNISKNSPAAPEELFALNDEPSINLYLWPGRIRSAMNSPDLTGTVVRCSPKLNSSGYSHLTGNMASQCKTLQNPLFPRADPPRVDLLMRTTRQPSPCATYESYQKLIPISRQNEIDSLDVHTNMFCVPPSNRSENDVQGRERLESSVGLSRAVASPTTRNGDESTPTSTSTPTGIPRVVQGPSDSLVGEKSSEKTTGKKKSEVSFV